MAGWYIHSPFCHITETSLFLRWPGFKSCSVWMVIYTCSLKECCPGIAGLSGPTITPAPNFQEANTIFVNYNRKDTSILCRIHFQSRKNCAPQKFSTIWYVHPTVCLFYTSPYESMTRDLHLSRDIVLSQPIYIVSVRCVNSIMS